MSILKKMPVLLLASTLAVIGLVFFQFKWMGYSRQLSEEIFNQRVSMALCSAVEGYGGEMVCGGGASCEVSCETDGELVVSAQLAGDSSFQASLRESLDFYQIDLDFEMALSGNSSPPKSLPGVYQCAIPVTTNAVDSAAFIHLNFPEKRAFMLGKMRFMIITTVLILLFTAAVLWFANWSLLKQKRLLETNVDFFNNMAHEFRTPLTNVGLATSMLAKKNKDPKEHQMIEVIRRENTKLLAQVERVLHLARVENGDYCLHKEPVQVKALLEGVREEMAMQIEARGAVVNLGNISETFEVFGDRLHLSNVFRNLLDNALKYSCSRPEIQLSVQARTKGILIQVQDNGIGIPASDCQLIFEKFQRVNAGDLHTQKGFGLGLAYVKSMVELHKGSVRASSEPNKGSRFEVFLPA